MELPGDRRGVATQVGAVLLLGFLVISISLYQAQVVPEQNKRIEFKHSQQVQNDMLELRNALLEAGTAETAPPVSIDMGTTYPSRTLFINPPPPGGLVINSSSKNVTLQNASAVNGETQDYIRPQGVYNLSTKNISYRPGYHVYQSAPTTTYQTGLLINQFERNNDTVISGQTIIEGNEIYIVAIGGNISQAQVQDLTINPQSLSTSSSPVKITNDSTGNITLVVPSTLPPERWRTLLEQEYDPKDESNSSYVRSVHQIRGGAAVEIMLDGNTTYQLRTAFVGVGITPPPPNPAYITTTLANGTQLAKGDEIPLEVRDRFNNPIDTPVNSYQVNVTSDSGDVVAENATGGSVFVVDDNGQVRLEYTGNSGTVVANLTPPAANTPANASTVRFTVGSGGTFNSGLAPDTSDDVFADSSDTAVTGGVKVIRQNGTDPKDFPLKKNEVSVLGASIDLNGDGRTDQPFVNGTGDLAVTDASNNTRTLVSGAGGIQPKQSKSLMAAGTWKGSQKSIFFVDKNSDKIYRVDQSGNPVEIADPGNGAGGVAGIGDIDADGTDELVFIDGSQQLRYLEPNGKIKKIAGAGAGSNNGVGGGQLRDLDADASEEVLYVDGSNNINFADSSGEEVTIKNGSPAKSPLTAVDIDGDGNLEILYVTQGGFINYIDDVGNTNTVKQVVDSNGNRVTGQQDVGIVT